MTALLTLFKRGITTSIPSDAIQTIENSERPLRIKFGADPSAPDLHLGHCVALKKLRYLQEMGHRVQFLIGDFTAMIGDPTGKSETRPPLDEAEVASNAHTYSEQIFKILDKDKTDILYNSEWLSKLTGKNMIELTAHYTVARMLERDDFHNRFRSNQSISIHEFLYPLLQGYDSVVMASDIEVGGTDQTFNLLMGRHLQREYNAPTIQSIFTVPILEGLDGVQKMSKSLQNHIAILDSPKDMFGKIMSIPDTLITRYLLLLTETSDAEIRDISEGIDSGSVNPRDIKAHLASWCVGEFHSKKEATAASEEFTRIFSNRSLPTSIPEIKIESDIFLLDLLFKQKMIASKKEGQRLIQQGGIAINDTKITDIKYLLILGNIYVIKVGKRKFLKVI
jgi:tyrosyl-tRNA synthetase